MATYYISNSGNDSNNGTSISIPWKSLSKVNSTVFKPGDQVLFQKGSTFYGELDMSCSGSSTSSTVYSSYGEGTNPIITGFNTITSWINKGNSIWESSTAVSTLPNLKVVSIDNKNIAMGSYPKVFKSEVITDLALKKSIVTSSIEEPGMGGTNVNDGNAATRWSSKWNDNEWIYIDLESIQTIKQIKLSWEEAYATSYQIQTSNDATTWTTIYTTTTNTGGINNLTNLSGSGRYVKLIGLKRSTSYGISLWGFEVYNKPVVITDNVNTTEDGYYTIDSHTTSSITSKNITSGVNWVGATVVIRTSNYTLNSSVIKSQSGNTINFSDIGNFYDGNGFFIQGDIRCCTQQNDWYYNSATKKLSIYSTTQPTSVKVPTLDRLISINANYININGIDLVGCNGDAIYSFNSNTGINITKCNISFAGITGIYSNTSNITIEDNTFTDINSGAIDLAYGSNVSVKRNTIKNTGILPGMRVGADHGDFAALGVGEWNTATIENNNIINSGYNAINFYGQNITIKNNYIDTYCVLLDDGGGIYTYSGAGRTPMNECKILGNIILNGIGMTNGSNSNSGCAGIYLDEESQNIEVAYNYVANTFLYGIQCNINLGNNNFHDNIVYNGSIHQFFTSSYGGMNLPKTNTISNNIFIAANDSQRCLSFGFDTKDGVSGEQVFINTHTLDNNTYIKLGVNTDVVSSNNTLYSLSAWQSLSKKDINSKFYTKLLSDIQVVYNETSIIKTIPLNVAVVNLKGTKYSTSIILFPYEANLLIKDTDPIIVIPPIVLPTYEELVLKLAAYKAELLLDLATFKLSTISAAKKLARRTAIETVLK